MSRLNAPVGLLALSALLCAPALADGKPQASETMAQNLDTSIREAQLKRVAGDYAGAVKVLSQLMLVASDDPRVVGEYGKVMVQQGRIKESIEFLRRAVQLQQGDWTLYSALGVAYDQSGDFASAQQAYIAALRLKPGEAVLYNNYAMSRMLAGDLPEAKKLMAQASSLGAADTRIARNAKMIAGLTPPAATVAAIPAKPAALQAAAPSVTTPKPATVASGAPRPLTKAEGNKVANAALPAPAKPASQTAAAKAAPVKQAAVTPGGDKKPAAKAGDPAKKTPAKPASKDGIPSLRLANDTP